MHLGSFISNKVMLDEKCIFRAYSLQIKVSYRLKLKMSLTYSRVARALLLAKENPAFVPQIKGNHKIVNT